MTAALLSRAPWGSAVVIGQSKRASQNPADAGYCRRCLSRMASRQRGSALHTRRSADKSISRNALARQPPGSHGIRGACSHLSSRTLGWLEGAATSLMPTLLVSRIRPREPWRRIAIEDALLHLFAINTLAPYVWNARNCLRGSQNTVPRSPGMITQV
jgi:hypothetical protein